eukprot:357554-Chlamydomonas_euryale.AAC.7
MALPQRCHVARLPGWLAHCADVAAAAQPVILHRLLLPPRSAVWWGSRAEAAPARRASAQLPVRPTGRAQSVGPAVSMRYKPDASSRENGCG